MGKKRLYVLHGCDLGICSTPPVLIRKNKMYRFKSEKKIQKMRAYILGRRALNGVSEGQ